MHLCLPSLKYFTHPVYHLSIPSTCPPPSPFFLPPIHQCVYSSLHVLSTSTLPRPLFRHSLPISLSPFNPSVHLSYPPSIPHFTHPSFPLVTFSQLPKNSFLSTCGMTVEPLQRLFKVTKVEGAGRIEPVCKI